MYGEEGSHLLLVTLVQKWWVRLAYRETREETRQPISMIGPGRYVSGPTHHVGP